jgi:hypothetical protein
MSPLNSTSLFELDSDRINIDRYSFIGRGKLGECFYEEWDTLAQSVAEPVVADLPPLRNNGRKVTRWRDSNTCVTMCPLQYYNGLQR